MHRVRVHDKCNNNCIGCIYKNKAETIPGDYVVLPCNAEYSPEFPKLLRTSSEIILETNARMFSYQKYTDYIKKRLSSLIVRFIDDEKEYKKITRTDGYSQAKAGLKRIRDSGIPYMLRPFPEMSRERKLTTRGVLWIGYQCNIKCKFCFYTIHKPNDWKWRDLETCKREVDRFRSLGNDWIDIMGGEPSIYPWAADLCKYIKKQSMNSTMITNCQAIANLSLVQKFKDAGLYDFLCSIFGIGETYNYIAQAKVWNNVVKSIHNINKMGIPWRENCVITKYNLHQILDITRWCIKNKTTVINYIIFNPFYAWKYEEIIEIEPDYNKVEQPLKEALYLCDKAGIEANVRYFPFCFVKGHEEKVYNWKQLSYDFREWDFCTWFRTDSGEMTISSNLAHDHEHHMKAALGFVNQNYKYTQKCESCSLMDICDGFKTQYLKQYGDSHGKPYHGKNIQDPRHFINYQDKLIDKYPVTLPFVSVIIPTHGNQYALDLVLESLKNQDYNRFEVIVVDDGSDVRVPGWVRYAKQEWKGFRAGQARNLGASIAQGDILVFLNADIALEKEAISLYAKQACDQCIVGYTASYNNSQQYDIDEMRDNIADLRKLRLIKDFRHDCFHKLTWKEFVATNFCMKKEVFLKYRFNEGFIGWGGEDEEFAYRIHKAGIKFIGSNAKGYHIPHVHENCYQIYTKSKVKTLTKNLMLFFKLHPEEEVSNHVIERYRHIPQNVKSDKSENLIRSFNRKYKTNPMSSLTE